MFIEIGGERFNSGSVNEYADCILKDVEDKRFFRYGLGCLKRMLSRLNWKKSQLLVP